MADKDESFYIKIELGHLVFESLMFTLCQTLLHQTNITNSYKGIPHRISCFTCNAKLVIVLSAKLELQEGFV